MGQKRGRSGAEAGTTGWGGGGVRIQWATLLRVNLASNLILNEVQFNKSFKLKTNFEVEKTEELLMGKKMSLKK